MIRLIASDIDGTLLQGDEAEISPAPFPLIAQLKATGILFAPASGRQYHSLRRLFAPAAEELCFLCENGAEVYGPCAVEEAAHPLVHAMIPRPLCEELTAEILARPDCSALISGPNMSYLISRHPGFSDRIIHFSRNRYQMISSVGEISGDIIKRADYCEEGSDKVDAAMGQRWRERGLTVSQAGFLWLDFTIANKGTGMTDLCNALGIHPSEVMAFGDNYNDQAMLDLVGYPVIMDSACPELRARYPHHCRRVEEYLSQLLTEL